MITVNDLKNRDNFFLMAGPCAIEGEDMALRIAEKVVGITNNLNIPYIFKGSYRKANRSRLDSFTGIGDEKALKIANYVFLGMILFLAVSCIPQTSWLRNPKTGSLIKGSLLLDAIVPLLTILFFVPGFVYGKISGKFKTSRDVYNGFSSSIRVLAGFICVSFAASQFTNYFKYSNLGSILSINGAHFLQQLNVGAIPLMIVFILVTGFSNLFMASASAKYAIFAPVFVPMFMTLGISPELTQVAFRIGDSSTNIIAPVLSSLPIILDAMKRYDKDSGLGTLVSCMLPFSIAIMVSWTVMLVVWMLLKLPLGPGAFIYL